MLSLSINNGFYTVTEGACCGVEIDATQVIAYRVKLMTALRQSACRTEIKRTAVCRENGECLIYRVIFEKGREQQLIFLNVIDLKVGGCIKDLDAVVVGTMEQLVRGIGRISDIPSRRMPVWIDAKAESLVGLSVVSGDRAIVLAQQRGTMRSTDMKTHVSRVTTIEAMAVDTSLELCVLNQSSLIERGEVAFINAHLTPHLVTRLYKTITDAVVNAVRTDIY
jgi:hypothetical protein